MRKLASIRRIDDIQPIPGADSIDVATVDGCIDIAEGPSLNQNTPREGLVFKSLTGQKSWKAISNSYLIKTGN